MPPQVLEASEIDAINEEVDLEMTRAEEEASRPFSPIRHDQQVGDLSDGGMVNGMAVFPLLDRKRQKKGRAVVRRAWMWNGSESMLQLGWNTEGTRHDGARPFLLKRYCLCCHDGGFRGSQCPRCVKQDCATCAGSTDSSPRTLPNGKTIRGWLIPNFYLSKDDVPFPERFYGSIQCFIPSCLRTGSRGFLTEQDMRMHARSRHRMEYQSHVEAMQEARADELADVKAQLSALMIERIQQPAPVAVLQTNKDRMAKVRAARRKDTPA